MAAKRVWGKPTEADRTRKCRARNRFEKAAYYVEWNAEWNTWAIAGRPHLLVRVDEVLDGRPAANGAADQKGGA